MSFRFPDGVEFLGGDDGHAQFNVTIPIDDDGSLGRECPQCEQHFRIAFEDYEALPDPLELWCVYCGYSGDHSSFMSQQQMDRLTRVVHDFATQQIDQMLSGVFGNSASSQRGSAIQISYRSRPFYPDPLPGIDEARLVRERACAGCSLRYAVFGEHRFCPVCGLLPALVTALDALAAERARLDLLRDLPDGTNSSLQESGVLDRTYADTVENVVGIIESLADRTFCSMVANHEAVLRGKGKVFQRLDDFADLFDTEAGVDLRGSLGSRWPTLQAIWAARHVFVHCDGIVDDKYLRSALASPLRVGQRLRPTDDLARLAIDNGELLCRAIAGE